MAKGGAAVTMVALSCMLAVGAAPSATSVTLNLRAYVRPCPGDADGKGVMWAYAGQEWATDRNPVAVAAVVPGGWEKARYDALAPTPRILGMDCNQALAEYRNTILGNLDASRVAMDLYGMYGSTDVTLVTWGNPVAGQCLQAALQWLARQGFPHRIDDRPKGQGVQ